MFETTDQPTKGFKAVPCIVSLKVKIGVSKRTACHVHFVGRLVFLVFIYVESCVSTKTNIFSKEGAGSVENYQYQGFLFNH